MMLFILVTAPALLAQRGGRPAMRSDMPQRFRMQMDLNLTDDQKEQVQALRLEHTRALSPLKNELTEVLAHQKTLMNSETFDKKEVFSNIEERSQLQNKISKINAEYYERFRDLLSEDQKLILILHQQQNNRRTYGMHRLGHGPTSHQHYGMRKPEGSMHRYRYGVDHRFSGI